MRAGRFVESRAAAAVAGGLVMAVLSGGAAIAQAKITGADIVNGSIARADLKPSVVQDLEAPAAGASVRYVERVVKWVPGQTFDYQATCPAGTVVVNGYFMPKNRSAFPDVWNTVVDTAANGLTFSLHPLVDDDDQPLPDAQVTVQLVCLETS